VSHVLAELLGEGRRLVEAVVQPVQAAGGRDVGQPLLHLDDVDLDFLDGQQQRQFDAADLAEFRRGLPEFPALVPDFHEHEKSRYPEQYEYCGYGSKQSCPYGHRPLLTIRFSPGTRHDLVTT